MKKWYEQVKIEEESVSKDVWVDSGTLMLIDPCYVLNLDNLDEEKTEAINKLGVVFSTKVGDGTFDTDIEYIEDEIVIRIKLYDENWGDE